MHRHLQEQAGLECSKEAIDVLHRCDMRMGWVETYQLFRSSNNQKSPTPTQTSRHQLTQASYTREKVK